MRRRSRGQRGCTFVTVEVTVDTRGILQVIQVPDRDLTTGALPWLVIDGDNADSRC